MSTPFDRISQRVAAYRARHYRAVPTAIFVPIDPAPPPAPPSSPDAGPDVALVTEPTAAAATAPATPRFVLTLKRRVELEKLADRLANATGLRPPDFLIEAHEASVTTEESRRMAREIHFRLFGAVTAKMEALLAEGQLRRLA